MFGFLKRIFGGSERSGSRSDISGVLATDDLRRIEQQLEGLGHGYKAARLLNRAGDLYLVRGERQNALKRYGDAIDAYLQAGEYDNAMAVCRKIIRVVPEVIRTRRTLAWLCLGKGFIEIAREHIDAYVKAAIDSHLEPLAVQQLQLMAQYVDRPEFREFLADKLKALGADSAAASVRAGRATTDLRDAGWTPVVYAAMLTPEELRHAADEGLEIKAPIDEKIDRLERLLIDPEPGPAPGGGESPEAGAEKKP